MLSIQCLRNISFQTFQSFHGGGNLSMRITSADVDPIKSLCTIDQVSGVIQNIDIRSLKLRMCTMEGVGGVWRTRVVVAF